MGLWGFSSLSWLRLTNAHTCMIGAASLYPYLLNSFHFSPNYPYPRRVGATMRGSSEELRCKNWPRHCILQASCYVAYSIVSIPKTVVNLRNVLSPHTNNRPLSPLDNLGRHWAVWPVVDGTRAPGPELRQDQRIEIMPQARRRDKISIRFGRGLCATGPIVYLIQSACYLGLDHGNPRLSSTRVQAGIDTADKHSSPQVCKDAQSFRLLVSSTLAEPASQTREPLRHHLAGLGRQGSRRLPCSEIASRRLDKGPGNQARVNEEKEGPLPGSRLAHRHYTLVCLALSVRSPRPF